MSRLTVCAPLGVEARALRRGLAASREEVDVIRTGYGRVRAAAAAARIAASAPDMLAIGGVAGGLTTEQRVGDLVVASEVRDGSKTVRCPSAPLLAGELRRAGLAARTGPIATVDHLLRDGEHAQLARASAGHARAAAGKAALRRIGRGQAWNVGEEERSDNRQPYAKPDKAEVEREVVGPHREARRIVAQH